MITFATDVLISPFNELSNHVYIRSRRLWYKSDCVNYNRTDMVGTDEDPGLRIESFAIIKLRGVNYEFYLQQYYFHQVYFVAQHVINFYYRKAFDSLARIFTVTIISIDINIFKARSHERFLAAIFFF